MGLVGWLVGWFAGWLVCWLVGWLVGCSVGWSIGWLVRWLVLVLVVFFHQSKLLLPPLGCHGYTYFTWNTRKECFCFTSGEKECLTQVITQGIPMAAVEACFDGRKPPKQQPQQQQHQQQQPQLQQ